MNTVLVAANRAPGFGKKNAVGVAFLFLAGCSSTPARNVLGSYFPSWMICVLIALVASIAVHIVLVKLDIERELPMPMVFYLALVTAFSFAAWLLWLA